MVTLSEDQSWALAEVEGWLSDPYSRSLTRGGYAGTGKTTLIREIVADRSRVRVCAYTGKAAYVLQCKGISATTIHRLIYQPIVVCALSNFVLSDCNCRQQKPPRKCVPETQFVPIPELDVDLIVIDEASMVNTAIYDDLKSFDVPLLFVGDHGQLEPIGRNPRLMVDPDLRLEKIHRQAEQSPIIRFAHHVRRGLPPETMGTQASVIRTDNAPKDLERFDVILCGKNSTRVAINCKIRSIRGCAGELPHPGERVICLRNDHQRGIFNGMQATVVEVMETDSDGILMLVEDDLGNHLPPMPIAPEQFGVEKTLDKASRRKTLWDFGYALTVHKSQGSEWPRVCVLEWIHHEWSSERWRYTAATRASDELVYCLHPGGS